MKYTTYNERIEARRAQLKAVGARRDAIRNAQRKQDRQAASGILPMWKAAAVIDAAMKQGFNFKEAIEALNEVIADRGLKLRADCR